MFVKDGKKLLSIHKFTFLQELKSFSVVLDLDLKAVCNELKNIQNNQWKIKEHKFNKIM